MLLDILLKNKNKNLKDVPFHRALLFFILSLSSLISVSNRHDSQFEELGPDFEKLWGVGHPACPCGWSHADHLASDLDSKLWGCLDLSTQVRLGNMAQNPWRRCNERQQSRAGSYLHLLCFSTCCCWMRSGKWLEIIQGELLRKDCSRHKVSGETAASRSKSWCPAVPSLAMCMRNAYTGGMSTTCCLIPVHKGFWW